MSTRSERSRTPVAAVEDEVAALEVSNLEVAYRSGGKLVQAVRDVSFDVGRGETVALVGESGSGKSTIGFALMGLLPDGVGEVTGGTVRFLGAPLDVTDDNALGPIRGRKMSMVFQDPLTALNPVLTIGKQLAELFVHHQGLSGREARRKAVDLLKMVKIPDPERRARQYPQQLSGGMRQRVVIAMALALNPKLVLADEPTTALDVTVQAHVMELLDRLASETGAGTLLISHDLAVVASYARRVYILYAGQVMERGPIRPIYERPAHPYTVGLLRSVPRVAQDQRDLQPIPGSPPHPAEPVSGCPFHPRCPLATERCSEEKPVMHEVGEGRAAACHYAEEVHDGVHREILGTTRD
ncbi:ABC transporter ATP-binding protein [Jiangella gansuensis]|uniref:ABC transporter ATP-binding protein n=1 Tax=Jiangella gansuensis TaxID=281473 RepID=UPI00047C73AB|nr:ABC transporter ATP-binding protein [Jiangella gansuensis]